MTEQNSHNPSSASKWEANSRKGFKKRELSMVLGAIALGVAAFVALDFVYSRQVIKASIHDLELQRTKLARMSPARGNCRVKDETVEHAFRPNCATVERWGSETYAMFTNSLALRDESIRNVPRVDSRPRLLLLGDSFYGRQDCVER